MIVSVLALALASPAPQVQQPARLRTLLAKCLDDYASKAGKDRQDVAAFQAGMTPACGPAEAAFRNAMITADVASGSKRADAEAGVTEEIGYFHDEAKEKFLLRGGKEVAAKEDKPAPATETAAVTSPPAAAPAPQ